MRSFTYSLLVVGLQLVFASESFSQAPSHGTSQSTKAGWQVLFDGKTMNNWQKLAGDGWLISNGELTAIPSSSPRQLDLLSKEEYENFELVFEFKMSKSTNSGVKYLVSNDFSEQKGAYLGLEYQIVDELNFIYPERGELRSLASLYDLLAADTNKVVSPHGMWNTARIVVNRNLIEHWLNGKKVVAYNRDTPEFASLIAVSKYKSLSNFGRARKGHLLLQNEGSPVAFKNIKIRRLPADVPLNQTSN